VTPTAPTSATGSTATSPRKAVVGRYMDGFRRSDNAQILSCLTDDIVWDIEGFVHLEGKAAYDAEIDNPAFVGDPTLDVERMVEEGDTVIITGGGSATRADGGTHRFAFADVFEFRGELISHRQAFVVPLEPRSDPIG
jgi:ketosteroid isomerase-like protein